MGGLFAPKTPKVEPPEPAPTPDDEQISEAKRRRTAVAQQRSGMRSAVLTGKGSRETLGG